MSEELVTCLEHKIGQTAVRDSQGSIQARALHSAISNVVAGASLKLHNAVYLRLRLNAMTTSYISAVHCGRLYRQAGHNVPET